MKPDEQYQLVVESLRLLAVPAIDQLDALPDFVVVTDEIVSTFGDAFLLVPQLERSGLIAAAGGAAIRKLDAWLDSMPTDGSIADASTLASSEFWARTRTLAAQALGALGEVVRPPSLYQTTWLKAT